MAKVIVERPRHGSRLPSKAKGYKRRTDRLRWEEQPKREGIKVRGGSRKSLNEHLAPLRRYLEGQVGRSWNRIFADICRYLDRGSAVQDHVRDHLDDYVAVCVIVVNGELCHGDGYHIGRPLYTEFYVCPRTGILKRNRRPRRWHYHHPAPLTIHFLADCTALVRKDGVWYVIGWRSMPERVTPPGFHAPVSALHVPYKDVLLEAKIYRDQALRFYGRPIYAVSVRRASKREVRQSVKLVSVHECRTVNLTIPALTSSAASVAGRLLR